MEEIAYPVIIMYHKKARVFGRKVNISQGAFLRNVGRSVGYYVKATKNHLDAFEHCGLCCNFFYEYNHFRTVISWSVC
jgi:hypothetical protein